MPADIPPPNESDNEASLSWWMRHSEEPRAWGMSPHVGSAMQSFIRRCHAAEAERERLRAELEQAVEALVKWQAVFQDLFGHCFSNGVFNAWGKEFNCTNMNNAQQHAAAIVAKHKGNA